MSCSNNNTEPRCCTRGAYALAIVGALVIVAGLVWAMKHYTTPASLSAQRATERSKNLADIHSAEKLELENYGWIDQPKGIVRLTVDRAMELTVAGAQNQVATRKDLNERVEKAYYIPPKPPEKLGTFE